MGGNALTSETIRLDRDDYFPLFHHVRERLNLLYSNHPMELIAAFKEKADFGDMDIIMPSINNFDLSAVSSLLGSTEYIVEGEVTSLGVNIKDGTFQIDLIQVPPESFDFAKNYYAMNDLGNIIGVSSRRAGFKLGHHKLSYLAQDSNGKNTREIEITKSWSEALAFLGYDHELHQNGINGDFKNKIDFFKYAASSSIFNPQYFIDGKQNHRARTRIKKRSTHAEFLEWIKSDDSKPYIRQRPFDASTSHKILLEKAIRLFPRFKSDLANLEAELKLAVESKVRTTLIREKIKFAIDSIPGNLTGFELGEKMKKLRSGFPSISDFEEWVLESSDDDLANWANEKTSSNISRKLKM